MNIHKNCKGNLIFSVYITLLVHSSSHKIKQTNNVTDNIIIWCLFILVPPEQAGTVLPHFLLIPLSTLDNYKPGKIMLRLTFRFYRTWKTDCTLYLAACTFHLAPCTLDIRPCTLHQLVPICLTISQLSGLSYKILRSKQFCWCFQLL